MPCGAPISVPAPRVAVDAWGGEGRGREGALFPKGNSLLTWPSHAEPFLFRDSIIALSEMHFPFGIFLRWGSEPVATARGEVIEWG